MEFTFGQAQKVVNMFFKYLYTFKDESEINLNENDFDSCDCPVDSIILQKTLPAPLTKDKSVKDKTSFSLTLKLPTFIFLKSSFTVNDAIRTLLFISKSTSILFILERFSVSFKINTSPKNVSLKL